MLDPTLKEPILKEAAKDILKESSTEIKRQRHIEYVTEEEITNILALFSNQTYEEIFTTIGLHAKTYGEIKREGKARKTTKYALLGLLSELQSELRPQFSFNDLCILFTGLLHLDITPETKFLQKNLANLISKGD